MPGPDGGIMHAEVTLQDCVVMMGPPSAEMETTSASDLPRVNASLYVYVDDVDAHHARAKERGATVIDVPRDQDYGDRSYRALDCEGGRWIFASPPTRSRLRSRSTP